MDNLTYSPASPRALLLVLYQAALKAVEGRYAVAEHLSRQPLSGRIWAVALGKAAASMFQGAQAVLSIEQALLITKPGYAPLPSSSLIDILETGHPIPDARSLDAGQQLLAFIALAPADVEWLFLISGGASSLVEVLQDGVTLADLQRVNQWLLASGLPIDQMNILRQHLSLIKGGKLCSYLQGQPARALLISDVPDDDPSIIGSGPLVINRIQRPLPDRLPNWVETLLSRLPVAPDLDCSGVTTHIVADLDKALAAIVAAAGQQGLPIQLYSERLAGEAEQVGQDVARQLRDAQPGLHVWGGEATVRLPRQPGQGGRCQQLALAAAQQLAGDDRIILLAAGTDGSDGPGEVAGACIDGATLQRGQHAGQDAQLALQMANAGGFLEAAGDLLETGPTGTNVTDLVIALKRE